MVSFNISQMKPKVIADMVSYLIRRLTRHTDHEAFGY